MRTPLSLYARLLALATHLALIVLLLALAQSRLGIAAGLLLFVPLPGLLRGREYTHAWASLLLAFYSAVLLAEGYAGRAPEPRDLWLAGLAAVEFVSLVLFVRLRARERPAPAAGSGAASP